MPGVAGLATAGLWYVLLGLSSPLVAVRRSQRGEDPRWHVAWRSFTLAAGMVAAFCATAWCFVAAVGRTQSSFGGQLMAVAGANGSTWETFLRVGGFVGAILLAVLLAVQILVIRQRRVAPGESPTGADRHNRRQPALVKGGTTSLADTMDRRNRHERSQDA